MSGSRKRIEDLDHFLVVSSILQSILNPIVRMYVTLVISLVHQRYPLSWSVIEWAAIKTRIELFYGKLYSA